MKQVVRLTEQDLNRMVNETLSHILKENGEMNEGFKDTLEKGKTFAKKIGKKISDYADKEWEDEPVKKKVGTLRQGVNSGKITKESIIHKAVNSSINRMLKEAESGGWIVDSSEAQEAYDLAAQELGEENINAAIVRSLGDETLAQCLAYIFRQYDFRQWQNR